jgi:hypothetical protein
MAHCHIATNGYQAYASLFARPFQDFPYPPIKLGLNSGGAKPAGIKHYGFATRGFSAAEYVDGIYQIVF